MAGPRGKTIPQWMIRKIQNIAIAMKDETGKEPYWDDVNGRLKYYMETTVDPATKDDKEQRFYTKTHTIPKRVTFQKILSGVKYPPVQEDEPWSLGISSAVGIPDDAVGALTSVWSWSLVQPFKAPFTIRIARWISKFRWLPTHGGSFNGHVLDPYKAEQIYFLAVQYAAMERHAEATMDKRGMRTPLMDITLLLAPEVLNAAKKMGFMAEWDAEWLSVDDAIKLHNTEFEAYAPEVFVAMQRKIGLMQGAVNADEHLNRVMEIFNGIANLDHRAEASAIWKLAVKKAMRHPRWDDLPDEREKVIATNILASLSDAYKHGAQTDWVSPADNLIAEALSLSE
jgi:hypothetical protein